MIPRTMVSWFVSLLPEMLTFTVLNGISVKLSTSSLRVNDVCDVFLMKCVLDCDDYYGVIGL